MRCMASKGELLFSPEDFIIATGEQHSVREFCEQAFGHVSRISINDGVEFRIIDGNLLASRHENVLVQRKMDQTESKPPSTSPGFPSIIVIRLRTTTKFNTASRSRTKCPIFIPQKIYNHCRPNRDSLTEFWSYVKYNL